MEKSDRRKESSRVIVAVGEKSVSLKLRKRKFAHGVADPPMVGRKMATSLLGRRLRGTGTEGSTVERREKRNPIAY